MKSILVIGLGRFGRHITRKFLEEGNSVLAVEKNEGRADNAINILPDIQIADATNETFIKSLGVNNFDLCVVAIGDNFQSALEITVLLKDFGAKYILARACRSSTCSSRQTPGAKGWGIETELITSSMQNAKWQSVSPSNMAQKIFLITSNSHRRLRSVKWQFQAIGLAKASSKNLHETGTTSAFSQQKKKGKSPLFQNRNTFSPAMKL